MKRLTELWCSLASELGEQLCVSVDHDIETVVDRVESEGVSFLTITLPAFATDFESALEAGRIASGSFPSFRKRLGLPAFLQGVTARIFDIKTGVLLTEPDAECVWAVRQLCLLYKKIELPCKPERIKRAFDSYVSCDDDMKKVNELVLEDTSWLEDLRHVFTIAFSRVLRNMDQKVQEYALEPSHGPGATADRLMGNHKWRQVEWPERFEKDNLFPYKEYVLPRYGLSLEPHLIAPMQERPVRVTAVPKTLTTPRIIAVEPTCMMYMQQALKDALVPLLEEDRFVGSLIGFTDQEPNRALAQEGSRSGALATLDLSEASDRVSYQLVKWLIHPIAPNFWEAVDACRSTRADVEGRVIELEKFASMGSALCFPIEAMVFTAAALLGIQKTRAHRLRVTDLTGLHGQFRVYGDDIIVPTDSAHFVASSLESLGLRVNTGKSFSQGKFRESCGGDYYDGEFVTPVRVRQPPPSSRKDVSSLETWVSTMNQLYKRGLWKTSNTIREWLEAILGPLPIVPDDSNGLGLHSFQVSHGTRMSPTLHVPQVKAWVVRPTIPVREIDGWWALRKCFVGEYEDPSYSEHLVHSGRAVGAKLHRQWVATEELYTSVA